MGEAVTLLQARSKVRNLKDDRIFPPSAKAKKAESLDLRAPWEAALHTAPITDFHRHDLRHAAASYLAMSGVSLVEIVKVLGHRTLAMVARYWHLSDGHIVATGQKLAARLGVGKRGELRYRGGNGLRQVNVPAGCWAINRTPALQRNRKFRWCRAKRSNGLFP